MNVAGVSDFCRVGLRGGEYRLARMEVDLFDLRHKGGKTFSVQCAKDWACLQPINKRLEWFTTCMHWKILLYMKVVAPTVPARQSP